MNLIDRLKRYEENGKPQQTTVPSKDGTKTMPDPKVPKKMEANVSEIKSPETPSSSLMPQKITPVAGDTDWRTLSSQEAYKKFGTLTPAEYLHGVAKYREENGLEPFSTEEIVGALNGRNPFEEVGKTDRREKMLRRAERINAIGNVLAGIVNYGRTKAGNPAMNLQGIEEKGYNRLQNLREYHNRLARQNYNDYMGAIIRDRATKEQLAAEERKQKRENAAENLKFQRDIYLKDLDNAYQSGRITLKHKNSLEAEAAKAKNNKDLEKIKQNNRIVLKNTPSYSDSKVVESIMDSSGNTWGRNTRLTEREVKQIVEKYSKDSNNVNLEDFRKRRIDQDGYIIQGDIDYDKAFARMVNDGLIPSEELKKRNFNQVSTRSKLGWGKEQNNETDW